MGASIPTVKMEAVFWDKEVGLSRSPVLVIAVTCVVDRRRIYFYGCPLIGSIDCVDEADDYVNFIGYEYDGEKGTWKTEIEEVKKKLQPVPKKRVWGE